MKKTALALTIVTVAIIILISYPFSIKIVRAQKTGNYTIDYVNHKIGILYNGYIFINDTIQLTGQAPDGFFMGLPYKYGPHILRCVAYNSSDIFPVTLDVPLDNYIGFYGVKIDFPQKTPSVFTVGFILSNNLLTQDASNASRYYLDFPAYPSFVKTAAAINVSLLSGDAQYISGSALAYGKENLPAFTFQPANVTFALTGDKMQLFDIKELKREIKVSETGEIESSDSYNIESKSTKAIPSIEIILPQNASEPPRVQDLFGRKISNVTLLDEKTNRYRISFSSSLESYRSTQFTVTYYLPRNCTMQIGTSNFDVTLPLFQHIDYYIGWVSVNLVLPEGARILNFNTTLIGSEYSITRNVFQETLNINRGNVSYLEGVLPSEDVLRIAYDYNPLWLSFRPTIWMLVLAIAGSVIVIAWKRPKAPTPVAVPTAALRLRSEYIKSFVDSYEEKRKIILELESLETMVRKGRIPRRRYKVRKKTLETRLNALSRSLAEFNEKMRAAGGKYSELMRQLEIAETEINEVEANIKSIEARHGRGEISLETYRKLLGDYQRRKETAETSISGILLRLREETS